MKTTRNTTPSDAVRIAKKKAEHEATVYRLCQALDACQRDAKKAGLDSCLRHLKLASLDADWELIAIT